MYEEYTGRKSPSARKVWIEIRTRSPVGSLALSPSARKVWIEIIGMQMDINGNIVTFRKEGVD